MQMQKPYPWQRRFDPAMDKPPRAENALPGKPWYDSGRVRDLAVGRLRKAPIGDYIYRQTKEIRLPALLHGVQGTFYKGWVYYRRNNKQFVRPFVKPSDPRTSYQLDHRSRMRMVQLALPTMSRAQRQQWHDFASTFPHLRERVNRRGQPTGDRALSLYKSASLNRLAMGLPVRVEAPTAKCTAVISAAQVVAAPQAGQLAFRLFHSTGNVQGLRVLVEMTPGMKSERRVPLERELTKAATTDFGSFFALGENGATYVLDQPRYAIDPGQRFGIRITILTEEGLRSRSWFTTNTHGVGGNTSDSFDPSDPSDLTDLTDPTDQQLRAGTMAVHTGRPASKHAKLAGIIYPLPPPSYTLPSHQEVLRRHRALYCPDMYTRPPTAAQVEQQMQLEQAGISQLQGLYEQLKQNEIAAHQRMLRIKRDHPDVIARGVAALSEIPDD